MDDNTNLVIKTKNIILEFIAENDQHPKFSKVIPNMLATKSFSFNMNWLSSQNVEYTHKYFSYISLFSIDRSSWPISKCVRLTSKNKYGIQSFN